jgi:putative hydroxymethylpyrimidine transporter CytX
MVSVRPSFGLRGANLASILNIIQLIGWASILLIIAGEAGAVLGKHLGGIWSSDKFWVILIGAATFIWALFTGEKAWKIMQYIACIAMLITIIVMTWIVLIKAAPDSINHSGLGTIALKHRNSMHFMTALDLVIAMPISFLPIVSDYSRFSRGNKTAFWNTWFGYFIISSWMYILGLAAVVFLGEKNPAVLMQKTLSVIGLAVPALLLVVFSTITSNFPDLYSSACSMMNLSRKANPKFFMGIVAVITIMVALVFPMDEYERYLLFIGAMFIPLFGVVLTDYFIIRRRKIRLEEIDKAGGIYWYTNGVNLFAVIAWGTGFLLYQYISYMQYAAGGSLPSIFIAGLIYYCLMKFSRKVA